MNNASYDVMFALVEQTLRFGGGAGKLRRRSVKRGRNDGLLGIIISGLD